MAEAAAALPVKEALLDGEIVALDRAGVSSFQALQQADQLETGRTLVYVAFDLLFLDGRDLRPLPLVERKARLARLLQGPARPAPLLGALRRPGAARVRSRLSAGPRGHHRQAEERALHLRARARRGSR